MKRGSISAGLVVFNEEDRLESTLLSVQWCDEIIVVNKQSTDRTREIAGRLATKVIDVPFSPYDPGEISRLAESSEAEWILWMTASDVVTPGLARGLRELISRVDFEFDIIHVPYRRHALGLYTKRSAWFSTHHPAVCRRSVVKIRHDEVHSVISWASDRAYWMPNRDDAVMYHLTHPDVDGLMDRHLRYCKAEAVLKPQTSLSKAFEQFLRSIYIVVVRRKFYLGGWDGVALALAFMTNAMLKFLYLWEGRRRKGRDVYRDIRERVVREWQRESSLAGEPPDMVS